MISALIAAITSVRSLSCFLKSGSPSLVVLSSSASGELGPSGIAAPIGFGKSASRVDAGGDLFRGFFSELFVDPAGLADVALRLRALSDRGCGLNEFSLNALELMACLIPSGVSPGKLGVKA